MLMWHRRLWLIDHGASLYFHHQPGWDAGTDRAGDPFPLIKDHVLLRAASQLRDADAALAPMLTPEIVSGIVDLIPDSWLADANAGDTPSGERDGYRRFLLNRLVAPRAFVEEAARGR